MADAQAIIDAVNACAGGAPAALVGRECRIGSNVQVVVNVRTYDEYDGFFATYEARLDAEPYIHCDMSVPGGFRYNPKHVAFYRGRQITVLMHYFRERSDRASVLITEDNVLLNNNTAWLGTDLYLSALSPDKRAALVCKGDAAHPAAPAAFPAIFIGPRPNHYHFLVDFLPPLIVAQRIPELQELPFVLMVTTAIQREFMGMLGIDENRQILAIKNEGSVGLVKFDDLVLPAPLPFPVRLELVRKAFSKAGERPGHRNILIARRPTEASPSRLLNEAELSRALGAQGFETVYLEGLSAAQQIDLFAEARCVVAAHGAGLANCIFVPRRCRVIELMSEAAASDPTDVLNCYRRLCHCLDLDYQRLVFATAAGSDPEPAGARDAAFECDIPKLLSLLAETA